MEQQCISCTYFVYMIRIINLNNVSFCPFTGEIGLMYMYLRKQFGFKEIDFSLFNAYTMGIMLFGKVFMFFFFIKSYY
jgi:hypothetical protein